MNFSDIKPFIERGRYEINMLLSHLEDYLKGLEEDFGLELNPDFQRGHVWTTAQQIAYIEFLLRGGESGRVIYFNCPSWYGGVEPQPVQCVDGLQRLTAALRFLRDEIPAFGHKLSEYGEKVPTRFDFLVNINCLQTRAEVLEWYLQFNSGGTIHSNEELARVAQLLDMEKSAR